MGIKVILELIGIILLGLALIVIYKMALPDITL